MREELGSIKGRLALAAAVAALLVAAGCGSGSGDTSTVTVGKVTVQTGSLSEEEFVEKATEICKTTRKEFDSEYEKFLNSLKAQQQSQQELIKETVELIFLPRYEKLIEQIGELGAPSDYASKVGSFLNTLQRQLEEGKQNPAGLVATATPLEKSADAARKAGLNGCAASLS